MAGLDNRGGQHEAMGLITLPARKAYSRRGWPSTRPKRQHLLLAALRRGRDRHNGNSSPPGRSPAPVGLIAGVHVAQPTSQKPSRQATKNAVDRPAAIAPTQGRSLTLNECQGMVYDQHASTAITMVSYLEPPIVGEFGLDVGNERTRMGRLRWEACFPYWFSPSSCGHDSRGRSDQEE